MIDQTPSTEPTGRHLWQIQAVRDLILLALFVGLGAMIVALRSIFMPVFLALMLAYFFNPLLQAAASRWRWPRPVTAGVVVTLSALLFVGCVVGLWPIVAEQVRTLAQRLPDYVQQIATKSGVDLSHLGGEAGEVLRGLDDPQQLIADVMARTGQALGMMKKFIGGATYVALASLLIPLYFFFFSWKFDAMLQTLGQFLPASSKQRTLAVLKKMDQSIAAFVRGRLFVAVVMGAMFSVGWLLAGVPYWFLLGAAAGALSIVPYGPAPFWFVAVIFKYMDESAAGTLDMTTVVLWPSVVYLSVQFFEGWILTPWIQSDQTDMSVPTVLIVAFVGGAVGGFLGLLLAIPVAACLKILGEEVILPRFRQWAKEN